MDVVLDTVFFEDTDTVDAVERREAEEGVFLARGLSLAESGRSGRVDFPILGDGCLIAFDGGRDLTPLGADVAVDLELNVEYEEVTDPRRVRDTELGVISDLAVWNVVDASLALERVESGREGVVGGRRCDGPGAVLLTVVA